MSEEMFYIELLAEMPGAAREKNSNFEEIFFPIF